MNKHFYLGFFQIVLLAMFFSQTQAAVFNRVNTVINTPEAKPGTIGTYQLGMSFAPYTELGNTYWEEDYYLNYCLTDFLIFGITRINDYDAVGNVQMLLAKDLLIPKLYLAVGIENITATDKLSTFDGLHENFSNNMSTYAVMTYRLDQWSLSGGIGDGRLSNQYAAYSLMSNLFGSASYYFSKDGKNSGRFSMEFDSNDYNLGLVFPLTDQMQIQLALTQLPFRVGNNPAYGNVPFENFSIGVEFSSNFFSFYGDEYTKLSNKIKDVDEKNGIIGEKYQIALANSEKSERLVREIGVEKDQLHSELTTMISELRKEKDELKNEVHALRGVIEAEGFKNVQTLKDDIMKHYYRALQLYYDEKYFDAIEELTKAKMINPNIPEIYVRLGSVYWTLGLKDEAKENWQKAYDLDKNNDTLNGFLKENGISFEKKEEDKK